MAKAPVKSFKKNIGFHYKANEINPESKVDLFSRDVLYFSPLTDIEALEAYLKENFDDLLPDAINYIFPKTISIDNNFVEYDLPESYIVCALPDTFIATLYAEMPPTTDKKYSAVQSNKTLTEHFCGIRYNKSYTEIELEFISTRIINHYYRVLIDPVSPEELQACLTEYPGVFLGSMGVVTLTRDPNKASYLSNYIMEKELV